jgi:DNA recombination protein RmuC
LARVVRLPIDSKFPIESYERLRTAQDANDFALVDVAAKQLENAVRLFAKTIAEKYVSPP